MEDFVTFNLAKKLKEKGFNEPCYMYYDEEGNLKQNIEYDPMNSGIGIDHLLVRNSCKWAMMECVAPTISQVLKWLREEKKIDCGAMWDNIGVSYMFYVIEMDMPDLSGTYPSKEDFDSYEQAALAGIEYVIDNLP